jgi:hypothetical protein
MMQKEKDIRERIKMWEEIKANFEEHSELLDSYHTHMTFLRSKIHELKWVLGEIKDEMS